MWYFEIALALLLLGVALGLLASVWNAVIPALLATAIVAVLEFHGSGSVLLAALRAVEALVFFEIGFLIGAVLGQWRVRSRHSAGYADQTSNPGG